MEPIKIDIEKQSEDLFDENFELFEESNINSDLNKNDKIKSKESTNKSNQNSNDVNREFSLSTIYK